MPQGSRRVEGDPKPSRTVHPPRALSSAVSLNADPRVIPSSVRTPAWILALQRSVGNRAAQQMLAVNYMEARLGHDFHDVRVHSDGAADASVVQRCGPLPCDCPPERQASEAAETEAALSAPPVAVQRLHRDADGRQRFDCPAFFGDRKLEDCLNDEGRLGPPADGPSVTTVQQALLRDGQDLGEKGADGKYGPATGKAVKAFKAKYHLGFEQFPDVGPGTMAKLDVLCPGGSPPTPVPPAPIPLTDDLIVKIAKSDRDAALRTAGNKLRELVSVIDSGGSLTGNATATAVGKWLLVPPGDRAFPKTVRKALQLIDANAIVQTTISIDRTEKRDFARVRAIGDPGRGMVIEDPFFGANVRCMREVMAHEFFHLSGLVHAYDTKDPDEAINCPHHMAELVFDVATGETEGCSRPPLDDLVPLP